MTVAQPIEETVALSVLLLGGVGGHSSRVGGLPAVGGVVRPSKATGPAQAVADVHGWFQPDRLVPWHVLLNEHVKLGLPLSTHFPLIAMAVASRG